MPKPVVLDHDGGHDDIVALSLLLTNPEKVNVIGCICTDADCFVSDAFNVTGMSSLKGVHPFPTEWRFHAKNMDDFPSLNIPEHAELWQKIKAENENLVGEQLLADLVMQSAEKVTVCVTGPLSNVAWCIEKYGKQFTDKVEECVIMGGAVDVRGNVFEPTTDGTAEWNIYWDAPAAKAVLSCPDLRNICFTLDSTNHVPVNSAVVQRFGSQNKFLLSQFVGNAWSMCTHYGVMRPGDGYFAWDVLTAAYIIDKNLADIERMAIDVDVSKGKSEGRTFRAVDGSNLCTYIAKNVNAEAFYDMVLSSMRSC